MYDSFIASIDVVDAIYSVPITFEHHKYYKFQWRDKKYKYNYLLNGLSLVPKCSGLHKPHFTGEEIWNRYIGH